MLTGVIYAAIVVAWAAYLIPLALRRHDRANRTRSIQRFSSAMRVLARRGASADRMDDRVVLAPARDSRRMLAPPAKADAGDPETAADPSVATPRPSRAALRAAAARRRRVLVALLSVTVICGGVGAFGVIPWWSFVLPLAMAGTFLFLARRSVRRASDSYWVEAADSEPRNVVRRSGSAARVDASHGAAKGGDSDDPASDDGEPTITLQPVPGAAAALAEERMVAVPVPTAEGGSLWDPLPVTLPTYVDAPAAGRTIRTIDLGEPGTWSSGHSAEATATAAAADEADVDAVSDLAEEAPRAANG